MGSRRDKRRRRKRFRRPPAVPQLPPNVVLLHAEPNTYSRLASEWRRYETSKLAPGDLAPTLQRYFARRSRVRLQQLAVVKDDQRRTTTDL